MVYGENPNAFWILFGAKMQKKVPKVSINDRFYKVFCSLFYQAPNHCFTNAFSMILKTTFPSKTTFWSFCAPGPESRARISPET